MTDHLRRFLDRLPENAEVLDLGCGSGRDSRYLEEAGCYVTPMDGSPKMCSLAEIYTDLDVLCLTFEEMEFQEVSTESGLPLRCFMWPEKICITS